MPDMSHPTVVLKTVSVIIPTFRRPEGLNRALGSVAAQSGLNGVSVTVIVCDNSPEGSARALVEAFALTAPFPVVFVHEPKTGVANARNAAVAASRALAGRTLAGRTAFIAFLDDDEEAPPHWLARLLAVQEQFQADVVFGPVTARLPDGLTRYRPYFETFFSRAGPDRPEVLSHYFGCGNSLIRATVLPAHEPFSVAQNELGGEDDILFTALKYQNKVMAWAADAPVWEDVPPHRATLNYTLKRGFAYGQGPSHSSATNGRLLTCLRWMSQGVAQAVVFGVMAGAAWIVQSPRTAHLIDKAARGLGKVLWFPPFNMKFYGQTLLKAQSKGRPA